MFFDLTKSVELSPQWQRRYTYARITLVFIFAVFCLTFSYLLLFPSLSFSFFFRTPDAQKNTIIAPRNSQTNEPLLDGKISKSASFAFNTNVNRPLDFTKVQLRIETEKGSPTVDNETVSLRKSYRSFLYPLAANADSSILEKAENSADNIPVSYGNSVYILSENKKYPVSNERVFNIMGYNWNDVTATSEDILSTYEKQKLFTENSPHPNGTVFLDKSTSTYYLIWDEKKYSITQEQAKRLKTDPIIIDKKSAETFATCKLQNSLFSKNIYTCSISIEQLSDFIGNDYQFELMSSSENVQIKQIDVILKTAVNLTTLKNTLSNIKQGILSNYYGQPQ